MKVSVVYEPNEQGEYGAYFPGVPGCVTIGKSLKDVRKKAREALVDHLALCIADEEPISPHLSAVPEDVPKGSRTEFLEIDPAEVQARVPSMRRSLEKARRERRSRHIRLNITLPEDLVGRADRYAGHHGETRSGLIAKALEEVLSHET